MASWLMKAFSPSNQTSHSLGDLRYKRFGVTPEPEVRTKLLKGGVVNSMLLVIMV